MAQFKAVDLDAGVRADVFIAGKYPQFTRSSLERLFSDGLVTIKKEMVKPSYKVKPGDKLNVNDKIITAKPPTINLQVIYEDKDVIVIDKPEGVLTHSKGALNTEATVASFIRPKVEKALEGNRAGIVHRLDRATSGVIITAKNKTAQTWLQKQFSLRKTKKSYLAIVDGILDPAEALIDLPISRNPSKPQTFLVSSGGKPSQTQYKVIRTFEHGKRQYSLLELRPQTGRTHQIRIHLAYIKHSIIGDFIYGDGGPHLMLHSASLELTLPNRTRQIFNAAPPKYFKDFCEK